MDAAAAQTKMPIAEMSIKGEAKCQGALQRQPKYASRREGKAER